MFDKRIEPCCAYCRHGTAIGFDEIVCVKNGIMNGNGYCVLFRYEPTKRIPEELPMFDASGVSEEDFTL